MAADESQATVLGELDRLASVLLVKDVDGDGNWDHQDAAVWQPRRDAAALRLDRQRRYQPIIARMHAGQSPADDARALGVQLGFASTAGFTERVAAADGMAYAVDGELPVIDASDPEGPVIGGSLETPGEAADVAVADGRVYVADGDNGLVILDVGNRPTHRSCGPRPRRGRPSTSPWPVAWPILRRGTVCTWST